MLQKAKKKYTVEKLKPLNVLYDHEHWLTQQDVDILLLFKKQQRFHLRSILGTTLFQQLYDKYQYEPTFCLM